MGGFLENLLVEKGLLTTERLQQAVDLSRRKGRPLIQTLISDKFVAEEVVLRTMGEAQGVPFLNLKDTGVEPGAVRAVNARFVSHYSVMPVSLKDRVLTVAVANPFEMSAIEDIETNLNFSVERAYACAEDIAEAIRKYYGVGADTVEKILDSFSGHEEAVSGSASESHDLEKLAEDASVVKLVNQLLQQAIRDRATDIHIELYDDGVVVRRRIDGLLYDTKVAENINMLYPAIVSRIKLMAGLNIVERRLPQDGRVRVTIGPRQYDLRVSVVPAFHGENIVVRILPTTMLLSLEELGFSPDHLETIAGLIRQPHGIILVTGPTGSGKSTTLYACLSKLNTRERKIITIEDPIEYEIRGLCQTQINPKIGLTFARSLRSMLRHDPDVMMVGEIRDHETAEVTIQTALTGHLVFSTLHTNDAASSPVRLIDMGIDPYLIASSVRAFMAQRLVRVICSNCRESYESDGKTLYRGQGCRKCSGTGYRGRVAICEILVMSEPVRELVLKRASSTEIAEKAVSLGMRTLAQDGWAKVDQGLTTADEVLRVVSM